MSSDEIFSQSNVRAYTAEFVAMTLFVFVGCGTAVSSQAIDGFSPDAIIDNSFLTAVSLAFGFGISVLATGIAPISGAHINPAVTFSLMLIGQMNPVTGAVYMVVQCLGAILGAAIVWGCANSGSLESGGDPAFLLGSNTVQADLPVFSAFLIEGMGTFLLVWTVCLTAVYNKNIASNMAPFIIGLSVLLAHLVLVPFTGCGINPARTLGPHLVVVMTGAKIGFEGWWVYYTAPFVGGGCAALLTQFLYGVGVEEQEEELKRVETSETAADDNKEAA